jgi:uncharacterized membrane protein YhaH (DUF805 family)
VNEGEIRAMTAPTVRNSKQKEGEMNFGQAIQTCMGKYATFEGRASRSEFWWFYLFTLLVIWGANWVGLLVFGDPVGLSALANIVLLLPSLAAATRRLHDTGRSGWWQLLALTVIGIILLIVWWASEGHGEENEHGPPPETMPA